MIRAIIDGSSVAITEPWMIMMHEHPDLMPEGELEPADQNFALTESGRLWAAPGTGAGQHATAIEVSRIVRQVTRTQAAIELLRSWRRGDETEQRSTLECLETALDENRLPGSKLFERE